MSTPAELHVSHTSTRTSKPHTPYRGEDNSSQRARALTAAKYGGQTDCLVKRRIHTYTHNSTTYAPTGPARYHLKETAGREQEPCRTDVRTCNS